MHSHSTILLYQYDGRFSYKDINNLFIKQRGVGVTFDFHCGLNVGKDVFPHCIFFSNLLENPLYMMFFMSDYPASTRMNQLKKVLLNHK